MYQVYDCNLGHFIFFSRKCVRIISLFPCININAKSKKVKQSTNLVKISMKIAGGWSTSSDGVKHICQLFHNLPNFTLNISIYIIADC